MKVRPQLYKKVGFICLNENPLKMMKIPFICLKALSIKTRKQIITIFILPNISRSKGNKTMKFGQLIESNVRNVFLKNLAENEADRETSSRPLF